MKKRLFALAIMVSVFAMMLVGCGTDTNTSQAGSGNAANDSSYVIGYANMNRVNAHCIKIADSIKATVEGAGNEYLETDAGDDAAKQLSDIDDLISYGCDAIIIDPVDSNGISSSIEACKKAAIPVFIVDVEIADAEDVVSTVATDNYAAGQKIGEYLIEQSGGTAKVAIIDYSISETVNKRLQGFMDAIDDKDIEILSRQDATATTVDAGLELAENFIQGYGNELTDIFAFNDLTAQGAINACTAAGLNDMRVYGIDGHDDSIDLIEEGVQTATAAQFPVKEGEAIANAAMDYLDGETVDELIYITPDIVTKDNAKDYQ